MTVWWWKILAHAPLKTGGIPAVFACVNGGTVEIWLPCPRRPAPCPPSGAVINMADNSNGTAKNCCSTISICYLEPNGRRSTSKVRYHALELNSSAFMWLWSLQNHQTIFTPTQKLLWAFILGGNLANKQHIISHFCKYFFCNSLTTLRRDYYGKHRDWQRNLSS